jgi:hypothetical protein
MSKTTLKTQIIKNAYDFITNYTWTSPDSSATIANIDNLPANNNVVYYGSTSWNPKIYTLGDINTTISISNNRTILVIWWDLYIKSNLSYSWNWMLWIIVLKDLKWNGWNIYIDPSVTNLVWSIFAEKSLLSYSWWELDGVTEATVLRNQLYIYGSLFTENTIGWSREAIPVCPYYIARTACTLEIAQKYDLNYLRRYYLIKNSSWVLVPAYSWKSASGINLSLNAYPVVIQYNPKASTTPPPLFLIDK